MFEFGASHKHGWTQSNNPGESTSRLLRHQDLTPIRVAHQIVLGSSDTHCGSTVLWIEAQLPGR